MKKLGKLLVCILLISMIGLVFLCGCSKKVQASKWDVPDYKKGKVVEGSAIDIAMAAIKNYENADYLNYKKSMYFKTGFSKEVDLAWQNSLEETIIYKNSFFYEEIAEGGGINDAFSGKRIYGNGTDVYEMYEKNKKKFPNLKSQDWSSLKYKNLKVKDYRSKMKEIQKFTNYVINKNTLSKNHDDKVYELDGKHYISITMNCMDITLNKDQKAVEQEIFQALGEKATPGSFKWVKDTVWIFEITYDDDKPYITALSLKEDYQADQGHLPCICDQIITGTISYDKDDAKISNERLMELAKN